MTLKKHLDTCNVVQDNNSRSWSLKDNHETIATYDQNFDKMWITETVTIDDETEIEISGQERQLIESYLMEDNEDVRSVFADNFKESLTL